MTKAWDEMEQAKENEYFLRQEKEALARLKARTGEKVRLSPISGEPMEQITIHGVVVDRCRTSGYIGLDSGELEQIIKASSHSENQNNWFAKLFEALSVK